MSRKPEAIVFIHGLEAGQKGSNSERLIASLKLVSEQGRVEQLNEPPAVAGMEGVRLRVRDADQSEWTLDVYEAYWGNLVTRLSQEGLRTRVTRGLGLLGYWIFSKVWVRIWRYKWLTFNMVAMAALTMLWYYGIVALCLTAIGSDPTTLQDLTAPMVSLGADAQQAEPIVKGMVAKLGVWGKEMGGWKPWIVTALVMRVLPVSMIVDISDFTRRFLQNELSAEGQGLKHLIRDRVRRIIWNVCESEPRYERVTVVAHSFGVTLAVDILANYKSAKTVPIRLVTLAGPLELLSHREDWLQPEIDRCASNAHVQEWIDFHSPEDWFGFATPHRSPPNHMQRISLKHGAGLMARLKGETHQRYFVHEEVIHTLLAAPPPPPGDVLPLAQPAATAGVGTP